MPEPLENLRRVRIEKLEKIRKLGIEPFPARWGKLESRIKNQELRTRELGEKIAAAGRLMGWREHGKIIFADLVDESGKIQLVFKEDRLLPIACRLMPLLDIGDFIGIEGTLFKTDAGELSIEVKDLNLLAKSLRPLPSQWYGLKDVEERYRRRYLDLIMNPEVKERFEKISRIVAAMREFLVNDGYIEVLTPSLQPLYGGTLARPFETFFNALDTKMYLRISNEMYLKRLIAGGFEKVFEFSVDFRNEGLDRFHNPEFLQMETMWAYADYEDNMALAEKMFAYITEKVLRTTKVEYQGQKIDLAPPWQRMTMVEAIKKYGKVDFSKVKSRAEAAEIAQKMKIKVSKDMGVGGILEEVFDAVAEKHLIQPTLIYNYHIETSPLAKPVPNNPDFTERFEIFIVGREFGNSYSEANDPILLRRNFETQQELRKRGSLEAHPIDEDFLEAMEYGMPPTSGIGVGMERLFMLLTNAASIREVMFFPALRPEKSIHSNTAQYQRKGKTLLVIDPQVRERFPEMKVGTAVIEGVRVKKETEEFESYKKELLSQFKSLTTEEIGKILSVRAYRELFKATGVDWHSRRPSVEALLRRIATGKGLYRINNVVDAYNLAVLESKSSLGAFDLDKIALPKVLRFAKEGEEILLLGETEPTVIHEGELIYADQKGPLTLDVNYRDCDRTKVTTETKNILLVADGCEGISGAAVKNALDLGCQLITRFAGGKVVKKFVV